jgi:predicted protein tyrosine phosphatase
VLFLSERRAVAMRPPRATAIVSITDTDAPPARLLPGWVAVQRVSFDDFDPEDDALEEFLRDDEAGDFVPLSVAQARAVAAFVGDVERRCSRLVVHCLYGQSRSAAVAKAICEARGLYFPRGYVVPNLYVHWLMSAALADAGRDA